MGCRVSDVSDWQASDCQSGHQSIGGHYVEFWCERSGYVSDAPLGLSFNGSLWFRWQLQNCGLLALTQCCQKHRAAVRKFQRVVMRRNRFSVDLPKDCCLMLDHFIAPGY